jgi:crotonobetainyl-CoA:carnitine CoA-transferase CaiB-like acyl-CoA transferase
METSLEGLTVLDLTRLLPGPYCTMLLADMGCEVIKIEQPGTGDYARTLIPIIFESFNRNKKSISLNLKHPEGRDLFVKLVAQSDIVIESFRPGVMARLGIGYEGLQKINNRLIYCVISGYGQDGAYADRSGHDINYLGVSGLLSLSGSPDGPPAPGVAMPIADLSAGMFAAIGILGALHMRHKTGEGQLIDVSMTDGLLSWMGTYLPEHGHLEVSKRTKMGRPGNGVYQTKDGKFITLGAVEDAFWNKLLASLQLSDRFRGQEFDTFLKRVEHAEMLNRAIQEQILTRPAHEWLEIFKDQDIPCGPVNFLDDLEIDPYIVSRGLIVGVNTPSFGLLKEVRFPLKFSRATTEIKNPAPALGEHNQEVLQRVGLGSGDIDDLKRRGIV